MECKRGAQLVNLPPLTDVVEIAPLQTLTGGICVSRASGELLCLAFHADNFRVFETDGQCIESTTPVDVVIEPKPVFVPELDDAVQVVLSNRVSCALRKNGKVRCWGKPTAFRLNADDGSPY